MLAHSFDTVLGKLTAVESGGRLIMLCFGETTPCDAEHGVSPLLAETERQIREYLEGERKAFDLPTDVQCTGFRREVMDAMARITYGMTASYGCIAKSCGHPRAARAVGSVCRRNPLPIIYPCHRVVPSSGGIGNYSGPPGVKERLLALEKASQ